MVHAERCSDEPWPGVSLSSPEHAVAPAPACSGEGGVATYRPPPFIATKTAATQEALDHGSPFRAGKARACATVLNSDISGPATSQLVTHSWDRRAYAAPGNTRGLPAPLILKSP